MPSVVRTHLLSTAIHYSPKDHLDDHLDALCVRWGGILTVSCLKLDLKYNSNDELPQRVQYSSHRIIYLQLHGIAPYFLSLISIVLFFQLTRHSD